ncbi:hypothetical protein VTO73DRAFT_6165 [Trametes versicolor]
MRRNARRPS